METQKDNPQGNASLAGAEFTWKYYAGFYNKDNLPVSYTHLNRRGIYRIIPEYSIAGTAVFSIFWFAEIGNIHWSRILRSVRLGAFGRRIYCGSFSKRFRVRRTNPDGERAFAGNEQTAGGEAYYSPAGDFNQCTGCLLYTSRCV